MVGFRRTVTRRGMRWVSFAMMVAIFMAGPVALLAKDKKKKDKTEAASESKKNFLDVLDYSKIVWPNPPAITRIRYVNYFAGEKFKPKQDGKKSGWMERLAGVSVGNVPNNEKLRFQLVTPYGIAVDSKGRVYVADSKVRAIFVFNPDTGDVELIKSGVQARFLWMTGLAIDDTDRLFVADSGARRILVFDKDRKPEASITEGVRDPGGMAIDNENRFLYVADAELDQVLVYDADPPYKLLRRIGTGGKNHTLTSPGDFSKPTNVAVDKDGNVYVTDTWNFRVEVFDAEGSFIRAFGKAGDGPGYFARPKGIAVDSDGHIWVADTVQDRVQVFDQEGRLLIWLGGHGLLPGQFRTLVGLTIDKDNRVFTSEQFPGRVQIFRYIPNAEADAEQQRRNAEEKDKTAGAAPKKAETPATKAQESVAP